MYNIGLQRFLQAKSLKSKETIDKFLIHCNITEFNSKNHNRVNNYIENNWNKFANFCDKGIKSGELKGVAVKLNTYFDEQYERNLIVQNEYEEVNLTIEEEKVLKYIKKEGIGKVHSFLMKNGIQPCGKNYDLTSKTLQWLPNIRLMTPHLLNEFLNSIS